MQKKIISTIKKYPNLKKNILRLIKYSVRFSKPRFLYFLLKTKKPISSRYGLDRGTPIDRYYIEEFLQSNKDYIKGHCLEILTNGYTKEFGGNNVSKSDVLDIDTTNQKATIYGDLRNLINIPDNTYDCIILTQVFQFIDDLHSTTKELHRILNTNGTLLITAPSISRIDCVAGVDNDYWRFTKASMNYLFSKHFSENKLSINSLGNALVGTGFWVGLSKEELNLKELNYNDKNFPCLITVRAIK
jgi:hypothetical protein